MWLAPDIDLGTESYDFDSADGTPYEYVYAVHRGDVACGVSFDVPSGAEMRITFWRDHAAESPVPVFVVSVGEEMLPGGPWLRASQVAGPLQPLVAKALGDLNAESAARRQRIAVATAAALVPPGPPELSPADRLRGDFDLGPDDFVFESARGREYEYTAETDDEYASVDFTAPSGDGVGVVFVPQVAGGRREVRMLLVVGDENINDRPRQFVWQFPVELQPLLRSIVADLNQEAVRKREAADEARGERLRRVSRLDRP